MKSIAPRLALALVCSFPCLAAEPGAEVVLAKPRYLPAPGAVMTKEVNMVMSGGHFVLKAGAEKMEGSLERSSRSKETLEVIAADKVRRLLTGKDEKSEMKLNGQILPTPETLDPLLGVPVILNRGEGAGWSATLESGAVPGTDQQKSLDGMVRDAARDSEFAMYGDTPRKPGDSWEVDPAKLSNFGELENLSGKFTVEFVKMEDFQGENCALLKCVFNLKGKSAASDGDSPEMDMTFQGQAISHRSLAHFADLDSVVTGTFTMTGPTGPNGSIEIAGPMTISERVSVARP